MIPKTIHKHGNHLIVGGNSEPPTKRDKRYLEEILLNLVDIINMRKIAGPWTVAYKSTRTSSLVVAESHIAIRTNRSYAAVDIFSCNEFDYEAALNYLINELRIERVSLQSHIISRNSQEVKSKCDTKRYLPSIRPTDLEGTHYCLDAICPSDLLKDQNSIDELIRLHTPAVIGDIINGPNSFYYSPKEKDESGITAIATGKKGFAAIHTYPNRSFAALEIVSDKPINFRITAIDICRYLKIETSNERRTTVINLKSSDSAEQEASSDPHYSKI